MVNLEFASVQAQSQWRSQAPEERVLTIKSDAPLIGRGFKVRECVGWRGYGPH